MVLDLQSIADIYYYTCEGCQYPIDLNIYADSLKETVDYILGYNDIYLSLDPSGGSDTLFCITEILRTVYKDPTNKRYTKVISRLPHEMFMLLEKRNNELNSELIDKGLKPKDIINRRPRFINP